MAVAYSLQSKDEYFSVEEDKDTGHVTLSLDTEKDSLTITVDAGDLARAMITASPTFAKGVGEIAQKAILGYLNE